MFLNSFRTRDDTLAALAAYPELPVEDLPLDLLQNREPKLVRRRSHAGRRGRPTRASNGARRATATSTPSSTRRARLQRLIDTRTALRLLVQRRQPLRDRRCHASRAGSRRSGAPFASEVCRRTAADRKGGHLAIRRRDQQLVLRDSAQTAPEDEAAFADITNHRYFNANNLWVDLHALGRGSGGQARSARSAADPQREDRRSSRQVIDQGRADRDGHGRRHRGVPGRAGDRGRPGTIPPDQVHQRPARVALRRLHARRGLHDQAGRRSDGCAVHRPRSRLLQAGARLRPPLPGRAAVIGRCEQSAGFG